jgi:hypothetical protein
LKTYYRIGLFINCEIIAMTEVFKGGVITFDSASRKEILSFFGKTVDDEGYIVEVDNPSQRVITPDHEEIKEDEFAGIRKGSEIYIKSNLPSLIMLVDSLQ